MLAIYQTAKRELEYDATRFVQVVSDKEAWPLRGGSSGAIRPRTVSQPCGPARLDLAVEAHVLKLEVAELFTAADRQQARRRLEAYGWHESPGTLPEASLLPPLACRGEAVSVAD
jgi:hypothetical protein